ADVLQDLDEDVLVGELEHLDVAQLGVQVEADLLGELPVRVPGVDLELVRVHGRFLPSTAPEAAQDPSPGVLAGPPPPASGAPLSSVSRASASPGRKAAMPT